MVRGVESEWNAVVRKESTGCGDSFAKLEDNSRAPSGEKRKRAIPRRQLRATVKNDVNNNPTGQIRSGNKVWVSVFLVGLSGSESSLSGQLGVGLVSVSAGYGSARWRL